MNVAVIGAGAFGGWTALELQKRGANVTLIDAWGPGHARSSSGGETRAIRALYGVDGTYVEMVSRAMVLWQRAEREWQERLMDRVGSLWMFQGDASYATTSLPHLSQHGWRVEELDLNSAASRFPQINFDGITSCYLEPDAGMLFARRACQVVKDRFLDQGGQFRVGQVTWDASASSPTVQTAEGAPVEADQFVFACGAWLPSLFPDLLQGEILPTREEVVYFGVPPGSDAYHGSRLPVWIDMGPPILYGFPEGHDRGFKFSDDTRGEVMDPTSDPREVRAETIQRAREYLAHRFPGLKGAPLLQAHVCQYENSPDGHYIIDRHPDHPAVWICGGGSGHGFKMGPAIGELMSRLILDETSPPAEFRLNRLATVQHRITQFDRR